MPQKIDIHGMFIDPETVTDLLLQKRIAVYYPVFHEAAPKTVFGRFFTGQQHVLRFDHQQPYGIILADAEQIDPGSFAVNYREAVTEKFLRSLGIAGKNLLGHVTELLKIDVSGDRQYRILQSGRIMKQVSIREIPARARLLSGQWVDVFKSTPDYDFQGGTPYAVTDAEASALMIALKDRTYVLYGAGVDASDEEVTGAYRTLAEVYNQLQSGRDAARVEAEARHRVQVTQINIQLPKIELPKIELPQIRLQSPFVLGKKEENEGTHNLLPPEDEAGRSSGNGGE